jgi:hypothetical protein
MSAPAFEIRYHVPKNQCYEGSRGGQRGGVHLHVALHRDGPLTLDSRTGRLGRITRVGGQSLCGKRGRYERPVEDESDLRARCAECVRRAERYGVEWPGASS